MTDATVDIAVKTKGLKAGWVSIAFPEEDTPTLMANSDAVSGDASGVRRSRYSLVQTPVYSTLSNTHTV